MRLDLPEVRHGRRHSIEIVAHHCAYRLLIVVYRALNTLLRGALVVLCWRSSACRLRAGTQADLSLLLPGCRRAYTGTMQATVSTTCPIPTAIPCSIQEAAGIDVGEIRAYKLGKKRWSYNQMELIVKEGPGGQGRQLEVKQAVHVPLEGEEDGAEDAGVTFELVLANDAKLMMKCFLVYDAPVAVGSKTREGGRKYMWWVA